MINFSNKKITKIKLLAITGLILVVLSVLPGTIKAAGGSLYLAPASGTFFVGSTFDVSIFINTGGNNVNAVQVDLKFDPKKIQIASPTAGRSFIEVWISQPVYSNIEGTASFRGGVPSPGINTSAGLVSTITLRAIAPGETTITFLESSKILLDDGRGTDILSSLGRGVYLLSILPPEGPEVFSLTHPDRNKWYKNNTPTFNWVKGEEIRDFSYSLDQDSQGVPDNIPEGDFSSISFSDLADGIWYLHIKARKAEVWGGTSHYSVQIDTTPPAVFSPKVEPATKTSVRQPLISFITTDNLSALDHFEIKVIDVTFGREEKETGFFVETASPYRLPALEIGKYLVVVRAFDKAGNWRDETIKIEIVPEGVSLVKGGVWIKEIFFSWWLIILIFIFITISVITFFVFRFKKLQRIQEKMKQKLKERKKKLKEIAEKIKTEVEKLK